MKIPLPLTNALNVPNTAHQKASGTKNYLHRRRKSVSCVGD
ncbi:MAG: hypothetical protein ABGY08_04860 [Gammaproteobacteria bacterium]